MPTLDSVGIAFNNGTSTSWATTGNEVTLLIDGTLKVKALGVSKKIKINESLSVKY